jgi:Fe-S cluster assembly ATPase SufC
MLKNPEWRDSFSDALSGLERCSLELQRMLLLNQKAEIQVLDDIDGGLYEWVMLKIQHGLDNMLA